MLVIGGGPAGSTCAALLAQRGIDVVLLEKAQHPRFHIGESLLPANLPLFEQLGVAEAIAAVGMKKDGVDFNSPTHAAPVHVEFAEAWDKSMPSAWQVRRSEFDEILLRNAQSRGARVVEGCRVRDVAFDPAGRAPALVRAQNDAGTPQSYAAQLVVDASGRDTFLANRLKTKQKNRHHNSAALYAHFHRCGATARRAGGQYLDLLVRARLVLADSAAGRHHEHRRRLLAVVPAFA